MPTGGLDYEYRTVNYPHIIAGRSSSDVAVQQRMGLLPFRRCGAHSAHRADSRSDWQNVDLTLIRDRSDGVALHRAVRLIAAKDQRR